MSDDPKTLVSTGWLAKHLKDPDLRVLDASWYLPDAGRDARAEYEVAHIPGARFFDIDDDLQRAVEPAPYGADGGKVHVAPARDGRGRRASGRGVRRRGPAVGGAGLVAVPVDGAAEPIAVLDGGLPKWQAEGHPTEDMPPIVRDRHMTVRLQNHLVRDVTQVAQASKLGDPQIVDARAVPRFRGEVPEPREGLRAGHIPGSRNLPYTDLLNDDKTTEIP